MVAISKEKIYHPPSPRIFVFGSNLEGRHGKGAALHARKYYGAEPGVAIGHIGQCYAIPTKDQMLRRLSLGQIEHFIVGFLAYAKAHPDLQFNVTKVACGNAGYLSTEIAPLFKVHTSNCWFDPGWRTYFVESTNYWEAPI